VPMRLALDRSSAAQKTYQGELAVVTHACRKLTSRPPPKKSIPLLEMLHIYRRETETSSHQNHSAVRLSQFFENKSNVMHAQHPRYGVTPGPLSYQIKRIGVS